MMYEFILVNFLFDMTLENNLLSAVENFFLVLTLNFVDDSIELNRNLHIAGCSSDSQVIVNVMLAWGKRFDNGICLLALRCMFIKP